MSMRKSVRASLDSPITYQLNGQEVNGEIVDIGLLGVACRLPAALPDGQPLLVSFHLGKPKIKTWVTPAWQYELADGYFQTGLEFKDLDPTHYSQIADFIGDHWIRTNNYLQ